MILALILLAQGIAGYGSIQLPPPPQQVTAGHRDFVSVKDFGAKGDSVTDDTAAIQAALSTGKTVLVPASSGSYVLTDSLFLNTNDQTIEGDAVLTMDAALAKPMLWVGATNSSGGVPGSALLNIKVRNLTFSCSGVKTLGSAGIAFQKATTTTLDSIRAWNCWSGIDVRGLSLVNQVVNPDLRQNRIGLNDRTDGTATIDFQGSRIVGGRIEANGGEGIVAGTADLMVIGTTIEGNGSVAQGGAGTEPEIRLTAGYQTGSFSCVACHIEQTSTATAMLQVDANACRFVDLISLFARVGDAANRVVINTSSNCTTQGFNILGGRYSTFKNWVNGAIVNGSTAVVRPTWADVSVDTTVTLAATAGASIEQFDRVLGLRITGQGGVWFGTITFSTLGSPANGKTAYCSDCTIANPCAGAGTGALAKRLNGVWVCN